MLKALWHSVCRTCRTNEVRPQQPQAASLRPGQGEKPGCGAAMRVPFSTPQPRIGAGGHSCPERDTPDLICKGLCLQWSNVFAAWCSVGNRATGIDCLRPRLDQSAHLGWRAHCDYWSRYPFVTACSTKALWTRLFTKATITRALNRGSLAVRAAF